MFKRPASSSSQLRAAAAQSSDQRVVKWARVKGDHVGELRCLVCGGIHNVDFDAVYTTELIRWGDHHWKGQEQGAAKGTICFVCSHIKQKMDRPPKSNIKLRTDAKLFLEFTRVRERYLNNHIASVQGNAVTS